MNIVLNLGHTPIKQNNVYMKFLAGVKGNSYLLIFSFISFGKSRISG